MANPSDDTSQEHLKKDLDHVTLGKAEDHEVEADHDYEEDDHDTDDDDDDESMFDMYTGEVKDPNRDEAESSEDNRSEASWEGVEEYERSKYDIETRKLQQELAHLPATLTDPPPDGKPKDIRTLNAEATEPYQWEPPHDSSSVHVLDLLPATDVSEPIQARMKQSVGTNYWAVSYCIGPTDHQDMTSHTRSIPCDGKIIRVTPGVYDMLHRIRNLLDQGVWTQFHTRPCIWVDAVCTDPDNPTGHEAYVYRAPEIFHGAQGTIIDLGGDPQDFSALFATAEAFSAAQKSDPTAQPNGATVTWPVNALDKPSAAEKMRDLTAHPWFLQRSTIQEFASNKRRSVLNGTSTVDFDALFSLMAHLDLVPPHGVVRDTKRLDNLWPRTWLFANLYRYRHCAPSPDPLPALLRLTCNCTVPQDVRHPESRHEPFFWCGHPSCGGRSSPPTARWCEALWIDLAHGYAREKSTPAVLALAAAFRPEPGAPPSSSPVGLPSWVPDWNLVHEKPDLLTAGMRELLDRELERPDAKNILYWGSERGAAYFPRRSQRSGEPGEWSGMCVGIREVEMGRRILSIRGYVLERPEGGVRVDKVDWGRSGWYNYWRREEWEERIKVVEIGEDWATVATGQVVLFVPRCELMFVVEKVEGGASLRLVRCLKRTAAVKEPRIVFVDREKGGEVWAYAHFRGEPETLDII